MNGEQLEFSWAFPSSGKAGRQPQTPYAKKDVNRATKGKRGPLAKESYVTQKDLNDRAWR